MLAEIALVEKNAQLLYTEAEVDASIDNMALKINATLKTHNPIVLCVMNGGIVTTGKLLPKLNFPLTLDAINVSRYGNNTHGSQLNWLQKPITLLADRSVLIIDDILDQGITLDTIYRYCREQGARHIFSAVLIDKKINTIKPIQADFIGLSVDNYYLYGSGMDYKGYLRNAAGIYACTNL